MSNFVLVLDASQKPLSPCKPGMARSLMKAGKAAVFRRYPFTIILTKKVAAKPEPIELKIDPGSKTTGIALKQGECILFGAELHHRGSAIRNDLLARRQLRRGRRNRKTRYRQPRFLNRTRSPGWLAPSLQHRVQTVITWVRRFCRLAPIGSIYMELVRFDTQKMMDAEVSGVEYQQGELAGYEVKEYLLEKWGRKCAYCGIENVPLEVEHIQASSRGGSNRVSNLTLACQPCNNKKGNRDIQEFLANKPTVLARILSQAKAPLKDAAAVNSTRWSLLNALRDSKLPVFVGSGGQTKFNRTRLKLPKSHWLDAACVGEVDRLMVCTSQPLQIKAMGHGTRQMGFTDKFGFPKRHRSQSPVYYGFRTGDIVIVQKKDDIYIGRVACRANGSFTITCKNNRVEVGYKHCRIIHKKDGYEYSF